MKDGLVKKNTSFIIQKIDPDLKIDPDYWLTHNKTNNSVKVNREFLFLDLLWDLSADLR